MGCVSRLASALLLLTPAAAVDACRRCCCYCCCCCSGTIDEVEEVVAKARMWRWKPYGEVTLRFAQDANVSVGHWAEWPMGMQEVSMHGVTPRATPVAHVPTAHSHSLTTH